MSKTKSETSPSVPATPHRGTSSGTRLTFSAEVQRWPEVLEFRVEILEKGLLMRIGTDNGSFLPSTPSTPARETESGQFKFEFSATRIIGVPGELPETFLEETPKQEQDFVPATPTPEQGRKRKRPRNASSEAIAEHGTLRSSRRLRFDANSSE